MAPAQAVERKEDIAPADGQKVHARGIYRARPLPVKGAAGAGRPHDRALLELADGAEIWLEPLDTPQSQRPADELQRCADRPVRVTGTLHAIMPSRGQGLLAPCIADIGAVDLETAP